MEVLKYVLCGFFMVLIAFFVIQGNTLGVIALAFPLIIVAFWDTIREITVGHITLKRELRRVKLDVKELTDALNELYVLEKVTDVKQLDKDGNYVLRYEPIKYSTVLHTGVLCQHEGHNFLLEGRKVILQDWWQDKKPEEFIKPDRPLVIRYMRKIEKSD